MSYWNNRYKYGQLIEQFINAHISGVEFEFEFSRMMRADRENEPDSHQEFEEMLSRIFTACDVFNPDSDTRSKFEYSEEGLRDFVRNIFSENLNLFK